MEDEIIILIKKLTEKTRAGKLKWTQTSIGEYTSVIGEYKFIIKNLFRLEPLAEHDPMRFSVINKDQKEMDFCQFNSKIFSTYDLLAELYIQAWRSFSAEEGFYLKLFADLDNAEYFIIEEKPIVPRDVIVLNSDFDCKMKMTVKEIQEENVACYYIKEGADLSYKYINVPLICVKKIK